MRATGYSGQLTPEEATILETMSREGKSDHEIAVRLDRTISAIERMRYRRGIMKSKTGRPRVAHIVSVVHASNTLPVPKAPKPPRDDDKFVGATTSRARDHYSRLGYLVWRERAVGQGIVDLMAVKESDVVFVEVKEMSEVSNHTIVTGVGQLLYYQFFKPEAKLVLAVPLSHLRINDGVRGFCSHHSVELLEI